MTITESSISSLIIAMMMIIEFIECHTVINSDVLAAGRISVQYF